MLVDLQRNRVLDLLPDRQAETLSHWLRQHPGVEIVARDRASTYADGARQGAPGAVQAADRWHLLRNLGDAVQAVVERHHAMLRRIGREVAADCAIKAAVAVPRQAKPSAAQQRQEAGRARRQARYEEAAHMHAAGASMSDMSRQLNADRKTLRHWLQAGAAPSWPRIPRGSILDRHRTTLEQRWAEGCHNAVRLWRDWPAPAFPAAPRQSGLGPPGSAGAIPQHPWREQPEGRLGNRQHPPHHTDTSKNLLLRCASGPDRHLRQ
ncbi:transposase [Pseudoroseomonas wenyumeiae]